jgi:hypothetical protein
VAAPVITTAPPLVSQSPQATFAFRSSTKGVTYQCALDPATATVEWSTCVSPTTYTGLTTGQHRFLVRTAKGGLFSDVVSYSWTIEAPMSRVKKLAGFRAGLT